MLKLLILIVIAYLIYRAFKNRLDAGRTSSVHPADGEIDDEMIQDPCCGSYFPKRDAVHVQLNGQDLYFCSQACKEKFITEQKAEKEQT